MDETVRFVAEYALLSRLSLYRPGHRGHNRMPIQRCRQACSVPLGEQIDNDGRIPGRIELRPDRAKARQAIVRWRRIGDDCAHRRSIAQRRRRHPIAPGARPPSARGHGSFGSRWCPRLSERRHDRHDAATRYRAASGEPPARHSAWNSRRPAPRSRQRRRPGAPTIPRTTEPA